MIYPLLRILETKFYVYAFMDIVILDWLTIFNPPCGMSGHLHINEDSLECVPSVAQQKSRITIRHQYSRNYHKVIGSNLEPTPRRN